MHNNEIQEYWDILFSSAVRKCGDVSLAEDIVQETVLAALTYLSKGNTIENMKAWLIKVMNRKYYDILRRKYKITTVTIGSDLDIAEDEDFVNAIIRENEAENVRREVSFLVEAYRNVITKHYFYGKTVAEISAELNIPIGTVKSRLDFGRKQMKKGFEVMEKYSENSYIPKKMMLRNSGLCGLNDEPMSLVRDDMILEQNLLLLAYERPVTVSDLSKAIGVASAYVEPIVNKLVDGELMKRMGDGKVYTDFIIYSADDSWKYAKDGELFVKENFDLYWNPVKTAIDKLKQTDFYSERLERYMLINIADSATYIGLNKYRKAQQFPDRPNGGRWIAFGTVIDPDMKIPEEKQCKEDYMLCGQRWEVLDKYLDASDLKIYNYETNLYPFAKYDGFGSGFRTYMECETNVLKFLYLVKKGISPEKVDVDHRIIKAIPLLEEQGFISTDNNGVIEVLVPCLTHEQERKYREIADEACISAAENLGLALYEFTGTRKKHIPSHLTSVPDQKLTMPYEPHTMMFVCEAIRRGLHTQDLGGPCPETYVVFD